MSVTLSPVGGVAAQFFSNDGVPLAGGLIYTYLAGTTTPAATYTSASGSISHSNPIVLDSAGRVPSGEIWLDDSVVYKFVLKDASNVLIASYDNITGINSNFVNYLNQQEIQTATAGQTVFTLTTMTYLPGTNSLSVFVDGVNQYGPGAQYAYVETNSTTVTFASGLHVGALVKFTTTQQQSAGVVDASQVTYDPPFTGSVATNVEAKLAQTVSVLDFGADPTGATDSTAAIQSAITAVRTAGGGEVYFPAGTYLLNGIAGADGTLNGILIPFTNPNTQTSKILLRGAGRSTILKAGSSTMYVIRLSDSNCCIEHLSIDGNGPDSVTGIGLVPEHVTNNVVPVYQTFNTIFDVWIQNCYTGIQIASGKPILGVDSGAWYNNFISVQIQYTLRGIWLSGTAGHSAGNNRNGFSQLRIGQSTNTGIQIDEGNTNVFNQVHIEGVDTASSPSATPTAIIIAQIGASGADNNSNTFVGCVLEANTRSLNNANSYSEFYGCEFGSPYSMLLTQNPKVMVGGDPSLTPQFLPGYTYQTNSQITANPNQIMQTPGVYANNLQMLRQTAITGPGGTQSSFNFNYTYDVTAVYLVNRGGYSSSSVYAMRSSYWYETAQGTFIEAATKLFDVSAGTVTWASDTVRRSATNSGFVQTQFEVSKAATVFTNWATVVRIA